MNQINRRTGLIILLVALLSACGGGAAGGGTTGTGGAGSAGTPAASPTLATNVAAKANGAAGILLSWTAATSATGYNVYRATLANQALSAMTKVNTTPIAYGALPYTDTGLTAATTYYYKVAAIVSGAENASTEVSATTLATSTLLQMGGAIQGNPLTLIGGVSTIIPGLSTPSFTTTDGHFIYVTEQGSRDVLKIDPATGAATVFWAGGGSASPRGITTDGTNLYIAEYTANVVYKVALATGVSSVYVTGLYFPLAVTTDGVNLYVADFYEIRKVNLTSNAVTVLATTTVPVNDMTTDGSTLYIAYNSAIEKVDMVTGVITLFAGSAGSPGSTDGIGTAARLYPRSITTDGTTIYVAQGTTNAMGSLPGRRIDIATATVSTISSIADAIGITTDGSSLFYTTAASDLKKLY